MDESRRTLTLRDAVARWSGGNSYDWYRKQAHQNGKVYFGGLHIEAHKDGRSWIVYADDLARASAEDARRRAVTQDVTKAYEEHRLVVGSGQSATTTWGGYRVTGCFHITYSNRGWQYGGGDGPWRCNTCWTVAGTERNKEECHRCRDWSPCQNDCQLSRVFCDTCGTSMDM